MKPFENRIPFVVSSLSLLAALFLAACALVPETGRKQILLSDPAQEMQLGVQEFDTYKKEVPISRNSAMQARVRRVGERLARVRARQKRAVGVRRFPRRQPKRLRASRRQGRGVHEGIFNVIDSDEELAAVIGHEIAHVTARHGGERMSHQMLAGLGAAVLDQAAGTATAGTRKVIQSAYGIGAQLGVLLPFSRRQELEADQIGTLYMARAGFSPQRLHFALGEIRSLQARGGRRVSPTLLEHPPRGFAKDRHTEGLAPPGRRRI